MKLYQKFYQLVDHGMSGHGYSDEPILVRDNISEDELEDVLKELGFEPFLGHGQYRRNKPHLQFVTAHEYYIEYK